MRLIIVHYHARPGGVRRIIELAAPHLVRYFGRSLDSVSLVCGEARDREWNESFRRQLADVKFELMVEPSFNYFSGQKGSPRVIERRVRGAVRRLLAGATGQRTVVWAHNLGLARNLYLTRELARACQQQGVPLVAHHHDWWFDNRWARWAEMRRAGFRTLASAAKAIFPPAPLMRHVAINRRDSRVLSWFFGERAGWVPNLTGRTAAPADREVRRAQSWLHEKLGDDEPVWILPCRLLRRKNIAEALVIARWLRPRGWLVTTAGVSSPDENAYARKLAVAARLHGWRLRLGIMQGAEAFKPRIVDLLASSETVMITSIQEGFGLAYLEAVAAGRPLIARAIPNIAPDLKQFGFRFPQGYDEILVAPELFDWSTEQKRQQRLVAAWRRQLPRACRTWSGVPVMLGDHDRERAVPFSRLTLTAQLEVLAQPIARSWEMCASLNPFLSVWRNRADDGALGVASWPRKADRWLSGEAYARHIAGMFDQPAIHSAVPSTSAAAQEAFIRKSLGASNLFPLLWACDT